MGRFKKNSPGCRCCGAPPCNCISVNTTDCGSSTPDVFYYTFTMPGLSNDACASCSIWSGDHKLCWDGSDTWRTAISTSAACGHTAGDPLYTLTRTGGYYVLEAKGLAYRWRLATASWQCAKPNTLTLVTPLPTPAPCSGFPGTVVLTACAACQYCGPPGTFPNRVQIDIVNVANGYCGGTFPGDLKDCASALNATFILNRVSNTCTHIKGWTSDVLQCAGINEARSWNMFQEASVARITSSLYWWQYRILLVNATGKARYITFRYTSATAFDCSVPRTLTFISQDLYFCDWSGATVTLTPL